MKRRLALAASLACLLAPVGGRAERAELGEMLQDPPLPDGVNLVGLTPSFLVIHRTEIGRYAN